MVQIEWSEEAEDDLDDILSYLLKSSIQYAESFFQGINEAIENIAKFPKIGRKVPESKNPAYRELIIQKFRLIYKFLEQEFSSIKLVLRIIV